MPAHNYNCRDLTYNRVGQARPTPRRHHQRSFTIPRGLKKLLEEMSREILRFTPSNIPLFLAEYLEDRLGKRNSLIQNEVFNNQEKSEMGQVGGADGSGHPQGFLADLQGVKDGRPIQYRDDDKEVALAQSEFGLVGKDEHGKGGPEAPGQFGLNGSGAGPGIGLDQNYYSQMPGGPKGYEVIGSGGIGPDGRPLSQGRTKPKYGGRSGAVGPYGPYDALAGRQVDVILGTVPEQIDNLMQQAAGAVDAGKNMRPGVPAPEYENPNLRPQYFDGRTDGGVGNQRGQDDRPVGVVMEVQRQQGQGRGPTAAESMDVLNRANDFVDDDLEGIRNVGLTGQHRNVPPNQNMMRNGPRLGSNNTFQGLDHGQGGQGGHGQGGQGGHGQGGQGGHGQGRHPYNPADVRPSAAPIFHMANAVSSDFLEFPVSGAPSMSFAEMIHRAIENMLQKLILAMSGECEINRDETTSTTDFSDLDSQGQGQQHRHDLFDAYAESTDASRLDSSPSVRLNPLNFIPAGTTPSGAIDQGYPNFQPGSDVAMAGSSVRRVYERGQNDFPVSDYPSNTDYGSNNAPVHPQNPIGPDGGGGNMAKTGPRTIPLKGLAANLFAKNIKQVDQMNLGEYVEGMVQRASLLVEATKKAYDENPGAKQNIYQVTNAQNPGEVTAADLLHTTTTLLATIDASGVDPKTGLHDRDGLKELIDVTMKTRAALQAYIQKGEENGEDPLTLEALRMGVESLDVVLILLQDSLNSAEKQEEVNTRERNDSKQQQSASPPKVKGSPSNTDIETKSSGVKLTSSKASINFGEQSGTFTEADGTVLRLSKSGQHLIGPDNKEIPLKKTESGRFITPNGLKVEIDENGKIIPDTKDLQLSPSGEHLIGADGKEIVLMKTKSGHLVAPNGQRVEYDSQGKLIVPGVQVNEVKSGTKVGETKSSPGPSKSESTNNLALQEAVTIAPIQRSPSQLGQPESSPAASTFALGMEGADGDVNNVLFQESRMEFAPDGEWSEAVRDFLGNEIHVIRQLLTGEIPTSEARGEVVFLSVSFIVGIIVGYMVARSTGLIGGSNNNGQMFTEAGSRPAPILNQDDISGILRELRVCHLPQN